MRIILSSFFCSAAGTQRQLMLAAILLLTGAVGQASPPTNSCRILWDFNVETNVVAYRVYSGIAPRIYSLTNEAGATNVFSFTNLACAVTHYFSVTAVDSDGLESDLSDEVFTNFPCVKPTPVKNLKLQPVP